MRYLPFVLLIGLACSPDSRSGGSNAPRPPAGCEAATHGIESGVFAEAARDDSSSASVSGGFTLTTERDCRKLALALVGPGGAPVARGEYLRSFGVIRLYLPPRLGSIEHADTTFRDPLVSAAYVVHGLDNQFFLDVHVGQPALALARGAAGRVEIDLAPGGGAIPAAAPRARNVVVIEPRQGAARYPLKVRGYARTFEANVQAWIDRGDSTYAKTHTTAADWSTTWGEFEITIPSGPSGDITLFVGEESAKDGTPIGVTIPLRMP
jgi:hypothetical protein